MCVCVCVHMQCRIFLLSSVCEECVRDFVNVCVCIYVHFCDCVNECVYEQEREREHLH